MKQWISILLLALMFLGTASTYMKYTDVETVHCIDFSDKKDKDNKEEKKELKEFLTHSLSLQYLWADLYNCFYKRTTASLSSPLIDKYTPPPDLAC